MIEIHIKKARKKSDPKMLTFEMVLKLRWKIWGITATWAAIDQAHKRTQRGEQFPCLIATKYYYQRSDVSAKPAP
jgi:hypothetical protein